MKYSFFPRTKILLFFIILFSLILLAKLFYIQVVHSSAYSEKADRQYATPSENIFERGTIFFTRKDGTLISASMQTTGFKLVIDPSKIIDIEEVYQKLGPYSQFVYNPNKSIRRRYRDAPDLSAYKWGFA